MGAKLCHACLEAFADGYRRLSGLWEDAMLLIFGLDMPLVREGLTRAFTMPVHVPEP